MSMKRFFLLLAAVILTAAAHAQSVNEPQIPNGDFETWTIDGANLPNGFNSFQTADGSYAGTAYDSSNRQVGRSTDTRPGSSGLYSCNIWARQFKVLLFFTVTAQGNLTTGRIHAGSTSATDQGNHNYSDRDGFVTFGSGSSAKQNPCALPFTGRPDSLVFWAKYSPDNTTSRAKVSAVIHDDCDYQDYYGNPLTDEHVVSKAVNASISSTNQQWVRFSLPFQKVKSNDPRYLLLSFATNNVPGEGGANDKLWIDDIELIYNHSYDLTIPSQGWASMYLDFNALVPSGATAYYVTGIVAGYAKLKEIPAGSVIPANTAVIVKSSKQKVTFKSSGSTPASVSGNILRSSSSASSVSGRKCLVLSSASTPDRAVFGRYTGSTLKAGKAYIVVD